MKCRLLVDLDVLDYLARLSAADRRVLRQRFDTILAAPANSADYDESDGTGRDVAVNLCAKFAIQYWNDLADGHIKVLRITRAD